MPTVPNTSTIINVAIIAQYLCIRDIHSRNFATNQIPNKRQASLIRSIRKSVQWAYGYNPADPTLIKTGEYLFALCPPYSQPALNTLANTSAVAPVVSGPTNDSVLIGQNASFTISVVSALSYTISWYRNGVLIPGETGLTYTLTNAQLTDSGSTFYATVANSAGQGVSATATLTVTAGLVGYYYYGSDYSVALLAGNDTVPYQSTFPITTGQPLSVTFPSGAPNTFLVIKYPATETTKVSYSNLPLNVGAIPSLAFDQTTIGQWKYVFSRTGNAFGLNYLNPLNLS